MKVAAIAVAMLCALAVVSAEQAFDGADCKAEAAKATSVCTNNVAKMKATATKTCNGRDYDKIMARVNRLKALAKRQEDALKRGADALAKVRANAARIAKLSGKERAKLLKELGIQKKDKAKLSAAQEKDAKAKKNMDTLRAQADAALAKAVHIQRTTGNKGEVTSYKAKAHSLYHKMVDEKLRIAAIHHAVVTARLELAKISKIVEKEIGIAKETAKREGAALRDVAISRENVASHKMKDAKFKMKAAEVAEKKAKKSEGALEGKVKGVKVDIRNADTTEHNAKRVEEAAERAKSIVDSTKVKVGTLTAKQLKEQSKKYFVKVSSHKISSSAVHLKHVTSGGASHVHVYVHTHGAPASVHNAYAGTIKKLEKERLAAKAIYHTSEAKLSQLKSQGANRSEIVKAQAGVRTAAANVKALVAKQHAAVMKAVSAVKSGKP